MDCRMASLNSLPGPELPLPLLGKEGKQPPLNPLLGKEGKPPLQKVSPFNNTYFHFFKFVDRLITELKISPCG